MNLCNAKTNLALTTVFVGKDCIGLTTNAKVSDENFIYRIDEDNLFGFVLLFLSVRDFIFTREDIHNFVVDISLIGQDNAINCPIV